MFNYLGLNTRITLYSLSSICASTLCADTLFVSGDISDGANWNNGLPTAANVGTINTSGTYTSNNNLDNFVVTVTSGTISDGHGLTRSRLRGGEWTMNGGTFSSSVILETGTGVIMDLNPGSTLSTTATIEWGDVGGGGELNVNGGSIISSGALQVAKGADFTMTSGSVNVGNFVFVGNSGIGTITDC